MYPTRFLLLVVGLPVLLSFGLLFDDSWVWALLILDAVVVAVVAADGLFGTPPRDALQAEVRLAGTWSRSRGEDILVAVDNPGPRGWRIAVLPDLPRTIVCAEPPAQAVVPRRSRVELRFRASAAARGAYRCEGAWVAVTSRLRLWRRVRCLGASQAIHVYPDLQQLADYSLLARTNRLSLIGVRASRRIGGDTEFERLRDWHSDDEVNRIDWKATARRDHLTVRDYQINQSQGVILMLDAGRMLASKTSRAGGAEVSLFDLALEAALLLAGVALGQNDQVGLITYADGVRRWLPLGHGPRQLNRIIHAVHDVEPSLVESRHDEAFMHLSRHSRKRSLVVLFTHLLDDVNAEQVLKHCRNLVGRHLPLVVLLKDPDVQAPLRSAPDDREAFWRAGAAALISGWRAKIIERLSAAGALVVDADPLRLTPDTINAYLSVKAKHLL